MNHQFCNITKESMNIFVQISDFTVSLYYFKYNFMLLHVGPRVTEINSYLSCITILRVQIY